MWKEVEKWGIRILMHKNCMKYSPLVHRWKSLCNPRSFWHKIRVSVQIKPIYQTLAKPCPRFLSCLLPSPLLTSTLRRFPAFLFFSLTVLFFCWYRNLILFPLLQNWILLSFYKVLHLNLIHSRTDFQFWDNFFILEVSVRDIIVNHFGVGFFCLFSFVLAWVFFWELFHPQELIILGVGVGEPSEGQKRERTVSLAWPHCIGKKRGFKMNVQRLIKMNQVMIIMWLYERESPT